MDALKQAAAEAAVASVASGMVIGLGTGSTAWFVVEALARRMRQENLTFVGVPTSEVTAAHARSLGIGIGTLAEYPALDLAIDGADEIEPGTLAAIKGRGGALLREKIVASAARRFVLVADASKLVTRLGEKMPVPVEVDQFGWQVPAYRLATLGARVSLRDGFVTDGGNFILDCSFGPIDDPAALARHIDATVGVVEHGLFLGMASEALIASSEGVRRYV